MFGEKTYYQRLHIHLDGNYDILSYRDANCQFQQKGTTTFSRAQTGRCIDGPKSCNCKFRVDDMSRAVRDGHINVL